MTAAKWREHCQSLRGGMTETERAIIHDLETLETDYHMLEAELAAVRKAMAEATIPLQALALVIKAKRYKEMTDTFQGEIVKGAEMAAQALHD